MSDFFYSSSTGGFYTSEIHGKSMPVDVVAITAADHAALMAAQAGGQMISADADGNPVAVAPVRPIIPLTTAQASAIAECIAYADTLTATITSQYPQVEVASWPAQLIEARLVLAGQTPPAPSLLQDQVTAANNPAVTLQTRVAAVMANAESYQKVVGAVQALRTAAQSQIGATTDVAQIPAVLATLKTQADAMAKQLGL